MKRLTYVGGYGPKRVAVPGCGKVERGGTLDMPEEVAEGLLRTQPSEWQDPEETSSGNAADDTASSGDTADDTASDKGV